MKNFLTLTLVLFLSLFIVGESRGEIPNVILKCVPKENKHIFDDLFYDESIRLITQNRYYLINSTGIAYQWYLFKSSTESYGYEFIENELIVSESDDMKTLKLQFMDQDAYFEFDRRTLLKTLPKGMFSGTVHDKCKIVDMSLDEFKAYLANQLNQVNEIAKDRKEYLEERDKKREERKQEAIEEQLRKNKI